MPSGKEKVNPNQPKNSPWDSVARLAGEKMGRLGGKATAFAGAVRDKAFEQLRQPALNARRKEALEFFANNKDALVSEPTISGYEPELSEQQQRIVEEFKKKSEGLWSRKFAEELCKVSQPNHNVGGLRGTYYGDAWRFIKKYDMPVSIVLENEDFYSRMVGSSERIGDGKLSEIYQTMSQTKEGVERFRKDFINNKRYRYDLDSEMKAIIRNEPYDKEKISDLKVLKQSGVCMLEGQDWSQYSDERSITRVSAGAEFLIQNNLFDGKEYGKVIADMLRDPRSARKSGFSIMDIASKAHIVPEGNSPDIKYWSQALVESGENKLEVLLQGDFQKQLEKLNFSDEPVMRLFSRIHMKDYYRVAVAEVESWAQSPEFQEALKQTAIQETIMGEIEHQMKDETMHDERPPAPFLMLASDRDVLEDMRRRKSFDNYPESISKNGTIRKASKNDFTEKDRLELYSGHEYSEFFDNQGEPNNYWYHSVVRYPSTSLPYSILSEHEKKRISLFEKMQNKALSFINQGSKAMSGGFFNPHDQLRYLQFFDESGNPKPEFWQASLYAKDFQFLSSQDAETKASMGFDETTMAFIDGAAGKVFAGEKRTIDESNAIQALMRFIDKDADDWSNSSEDDLLIKEAFDGNDVKDLSLAKLRSLYEEYLKNGNSMQFPNVLTAMADYMHSKGGAGPLTQIEAFLDYAGVLGNSMQEAKKDDDWRNELITNVATIEEMMQKYRWDNQEKSNFYATSAEIINASPELFQEFTQLFVNNLSKEEFKAFTGEIYPLYRAKLALLREYEDHSNGIGEGYTTIKYNPYDIDNLKNQLHTALLPFNCKEVSLEKRRKGIERVKENIFSEISELFKTKFSILPEAIPSELSKADARVVGDMTRYLGSLAQPNQQKKDILGFYLALQLDRDQTAWKKIRSGEDVSPSNYLDIVSSFGVKQAVEQSRRNNPITLESTRIDNPERLIKFRRALQSETVSMRFGNIQTVDLRLQNLRGNMEELIDPDLYPEGIDRQRVELLRELPSQKEFNKIIGTIQQRMMGKDIPLTDEGRLIMGRVEQILKDNDLEVNTNNIKQYFQTDMKTIQAPFRILESIDSYGVVDSIRELQAMLNPPDSVAQILEKLGETPKPQSGIMALGADLDYLENLMVKRANELTADESNTLGEYLNSIRKKLTELDGIYGKVIENYNTMKKNGVHPSTLNQIKEIDKIISNEANQSIITTTCANDMTTIIENMRACLSCVTKGINNDTNLTFGEGYKFYLYSRENASRNSSVADEIVYFVPSEDEGGANKRLSFVMDQVYGMKNSDIMMAHIETMLKKAHELKSEFPEAPISVILPSSSIMSCSANVDAMELSRRIGSGDGFEDIRDKTVTVPESGFGDHYIEFGHGRARVSGPRTVSGIEIVINPTADPQPAMVNNG